MMREIRVRELRAATVDRLHEWIPAVIVSDGVPVACLVSVHDGVQRVERAHDGVHRGLQSEPGAELPLSKRSQAAGHSYRPGYGRAMP